MLVCANQRTQKWCVRDGESVKDGRGGGQAGKEKIKAYSTWRNLRQDVEIFSQKKLVWAQGKGGKKRDKIGDLQIPFFSFGPRLAREGNWRG